MITTFLPPSRKRGNSGANLIRFLVIVMYWLPRYLGVGPVLSDEFCMEQTASAFLRDLNLQEDPFAKAGKHGFSLTAKE